MQSYCDIIKSGVSAFDVGGGGDPPVYIKQWEEINDGEYFYIGQAVTGSATSDATWRIYKAVFASNSGYKVYASGTTSFDKVWDDRASYVYS